MNSKERVKRALAHEEPDRVPIFELTIDNPTAKYVLGRDNLCGFGGMARGVKQNEALVNGRFATYTQQRVADEIELWQTLDLDVYPNAYPVPKHPTVPEQIAPHTWRFTDSATGHWTISKHSPESDTYDQIDSTLRQEGLDALRIHTEAIEAATPSLDDWDFTPVETFVRELGQGRFVMGVADVEIGSTWDWAEHFLMGLDSRPRPDSPLPRCPPADHVDVDGRNA